MGLTPEQMQSVVADREKYAQMEVEREKIAAMREMNSAKEALINQQIKESQNRLDKDNDLVDIGGFKVPRSEAVSTMSELADIRLKLGKIDEETYMKDLEKAYEVAKTNAAINSGKNSLAAASKSNTEMLLLKERLNAIKRIRETGEMSDADAAILGRTKPTVKPPQKYSQAATLLKNEMVSTNLMGGIQDPVAQKRYAAAEGLMADLWKAGKRGVKIVSQAREFIYRAEQTCVNKYLEAGANGDKKEQKKILDSFINQFGYIPPKIEEMIGEE